MSDAVFLIASASSGISAETARHASRAGYRVVLATRSDKTSKGKSRRSGMTAYADR